MAALGKNFIVGAEFDDAGEQDAGAAYLFDGDPTSLDYHGPVSA
jgi:hypothetical protein